ncbi:SDR family oxidoreductase [Hyalangium sp.]|uniref:SDR family oxidoreductase n=1 Tax=Hyalangium sp. TaxID=2028555 RepID=UPI00389A2A6B
MNAIVIIGLGGIGEAVAQALVDVPAPLVLGWHSSDQAAQRVVEARRAANQPVHAYSIDATSAESCKAFFKQARTEVGKLSAVVNCFGTVAFGGGPQPGAGADTVIRDNLEGVVNVCRSASFSLMKAGGGTIVNVGSATAGHALAGLSLYSAAKAGVAAFTRTLAMEVAPFGITCNLVSPGFIEAGATAKLPEELKKTIAAEIPLARLGTAQEVADLIRFLVLSPAARYMTGQELTIDGGWSMGATHLSQLLRRQAASSAT